MLGPDPFGDLCPSCGVPLPLGRRSQRCSHCGARPGSDAAPAQGRLTQFGRVLMGLMLGTHLGIAVALTDRDIALGDPRLVLFPLAGALACCGLVVALGRRLHPGVLPGFEVLLCGLVCGGLSLLVLTLAGVALAETLLAAGVLTTIAGALLGRRLLGHDRRSG
jgi:hypothetical protein